MGFMKTKISLLIAVILFVTTNIWAQDIVYKKDGEIIEAKVLSVNQSTINIKLFRNQRGPEYSISKTDVLKIKYSNGTYDIFGVGGDKIGVDENGSQIISKTRSGSGGWERRRNIIAVAPVQVTENGMGLSISYERVLNKKGWISFYCPVAMCYLSAMPFEVLANSLSSTDLNYPMYSIRPGLKFYTNMKGSSKLKWAINPCLLLGYCDKSYYNFFYDRYNSTSYDENKSRELAGFMLNIGRNAPMGQHLNLGFDFGLGINFKEQPENGVTSPTPLFQASFRVGYAFGKKLLRPIL